MSTVLITGSSGLVGSSCVRHFHALGWDVHGLDNNQRKEFFGSDGDTRSNLERLKADCPRFQSRNISVLDYDGHDINSLVRQSKPDLVIHAAAQPSHDYAADHTLHDFHINAGGTLCLLEAVRQYAPAAVFVFLSTNKVYGDVPNNWRFEELPTRYSYLYDYGWPGFDEGVCIDQSTHSLFGCSKLAADLYVQEYGRYFGMKTACFRCGCLTGGAHAGAEQHGFLSYLVRCCREGRKYVIHGYKGKQVRDQLHAYDVARACEEFFKNPRPGECYNLGGGRDNSVSVLEAISLVEKAVGKTLDWQYVDEPRRGDHIVWVSDTSKFRSHFPDWSVTRSLTDITAELCEHSALSAPIAT